MQPYAPALRGAPLGKPRPLASMGVSAPPPPGPDPMFTEYSGLAGYLEPLAVLAITGSAAWLGIRAALAPRQDVYVQTAGWIGGVGSALLGLFYVGAKSGLGSQIGLPAVRVNPI